MTACSNNSHVFINNKEHVKLGQNFADRFYKTLSQKNVEKALTFFTPEVSRTEILTLLKQNEELFGELEQIKFITANSEINEQDTVLNGKMNLVFDVKYARLSTTENLYLIVVNNKIQLEGYDYKVNISKLQ